jgi:hydrogenase-4 component E
MLIQLMTAFLVLINLVMLGSSRLGSLIHAVAAQAFLLCILGSIVHRHHLGWLGWAFLVVTILVKVILLPSLMKRALRETVLRRDVEPLIGYSLSLCLGLVMLGACLWAAAQLPLPAGREIGLVVAATFFSIGVGLFLVVSRSKAITQAIGYLSLENGIYGLGLAVAASSPLIVEMGILLDVLVGIFVMGIMISDINREFDHIDTTQLTTLKD